MKLMTALALGTTALMLTGCGESTTHEVKLPSDQTNLSCAAAIFAATNLIDKKVEARATDGSIVDYIAVMTQYGTAYAQSEGIGADESLAKIKLAAYRLTGVGGGGGMSDSMIVSRAKRCAGT